MVQLVKYDVHTTHKIKFIHAIIYHILLFYCGPEVLFETCVAMKFVDDDDDDDDYDDMAAG